VRPGWGATARRLAIAAAGLSVAAALMWRAEPVQALDVERLRVAASALGPRAEAGVRDLLALLQRIGAADELTRAREVNDFYNRRIRYGTDQAIWNVENHWASPLQTLDKGRGDCEDYVIAKYYTLVAAGIPPARLRMAYVAISVPPAAPDRPGDKSVPHMVLAYYAQPGAEPLILDNVVPEVQPASRRPDLATPTYMFNAEGAWQPQAGQDRRIGDASLLARWPGRAMRAAAEGF
jgi:predicted transglutaminase-like cysteine proteinase